MSKNPGQEKTWPDAQPEAQPEAPANSFKKPIQNSKQQPHKWGGRFSARPIFGASAACGASVVVLNFVSIFCRNLLELLAELLAKFSLGLEYLTFLFDFLLRHFLRWKNCQKRSIFFSFCQIHLSAKTRFLWFFNGFCEFLNPFYEFLIPFC